MPNPLRRRSCALALLFVAPLLGAPLAAWLLRGVVATSIARGELEARGLECDDRFAVEPTALLGAATVGPVRCTRQDGIVAAVELLGPMRVELDGFEPSSAEVDALRVELRDTDVKGGSRWARALGRLNLEQRVAGMVKGLGELSDLGLPPLAAARVDVVRGEGPVATGTGLRLAPGGSMALSAERIRFVAGPMSVGELELSDVTGFATRPEVHLEGHAVARAGLGIIGFSAGGRFTLDARDLDTTRPRFSLGGSFF